MGKAIVGYGRSGTSYLSSLLNDISDFTVMHEPRGNRDELQKDNPNYIHKILESFRHPKYMEVNSYLRHWMPQLESNNIPIVILLRKPSDIYLSVCNRKAQETHKKHMDSIISDYTRFFSSKHPKIKFESIMVDSAIDSLMESLCMERVKHGRGDYDRNPNRTKIYKNIGELPAKSLSGIDAIHRLDEQYNRTKCNFL